MNMVTNEIFCPMLAKNIAELICQDVSTAAEGMQPDRFAPQEFRDIPNWKEFCLNCQKRPE